MARSHDQKLDILFQPADYVPGQNGDAQILSRFRVEPSRLICIDESMESVATMAVAETTMAAVTDGGATIDIIDVFYNISGSLVRHIAKVQGRRYQLTRNGHSAQHPTLHRPDTAAGQSNWTAIDIFVPTTAQIVEVGRQLGIAAAYRF